jgi:hypothetical protein
MINGSMDGQRFRYRTVHATGAERERIVQANAMMLAINKKIEACSKFSRTSFSVVAIAVL